MKLFKIVHKIFLLYLKGWETALKVAPPAAARETLPHVATKLESTAQCRMFPVPPPPHYRTAAQNEQVVANEGGGIDETVRKKGAHELCQLPTSLAAFTDQFREGKAYIHLKLNLAKSYKQEATSNYTHNVMAP